MFGRCKSSSSICLLKEPISSVFFAIITITLRLLKVLLTARYLIQVKSEKWVSWIGDSWLCCLFRRWNSESVKTAIFIVQRTKFFRSKDITRGVLNELSQVGMMWNTTSYSNFGLFFKLINFKELSLIVVKFTNRSRNND